MLPTVLPTVLTWVAPHRRCYLGHPRKYLHRLLVDGLAAALAVLEAGDALLAEQVFARLVKDALGYGKEIPRIESGRAGKRGIQLV